MRLLEVPADRLVVLGRVADAAFDPVGELRVQLGARALQEAAIGRIADQHVVEAQDRLAEEPAGIALDELAPAERLEPGVELLASRALRPRPSEERRHRAPREVPADHRRTLEHVALLGSQTLDARRQQRVNGRGHLE